MFLLIIIWGHENRIHAGIKFFIFTQAGGLGMLLSILLVYFSHGRNTGVYTFDFPELLKSSINPDVLVFIVGGFLLAFLVKLPVVMLHTWLPEAHTQAPTAGSIILAGLLLKTGAYGIIRFVLPLYHGLALNPAPVLMTLGAIGILYGAKLAFAQTDIKRLIAYSSVSHMGFVLLGIFSFNEMALSGAVVQMIAHGLSTGALFMIAGSLQERISSRSLDQMGGLWKQAPRMASLALIFVLASLGLPGFGNFIGEFLILAGAFKSEVLITATASLGFIASVIYGLRFFQRIFYGPPGNRSVSDFSFRETAAMASLAVAILWLGIFPQAVISGAAFHNIFSAEGKSGVEKESPASYQKIVIKTNKIW